MIVNEFFFFVYQMARYKKTGFMDDDAGSVSSIQLNEGVRSGGTHIRYHMVSDTKYI